MLAWNKRGSPPVHTRQVHASLDQWSQVRVPITSDRILLDSRLGVIYKEMTPGTDLLLPGEWEYSFSQAILLYGVHIHIRLWCRERRVCSRHVNCNPVLFHPVAEPQMVWMGSYNHDWQRSFQTDKLENFQQYHDTLASL